MRVVWSGLAPPAISLAETLRSWWQDARLRSANWKNVILRRYFFYLEHLIDRGTQWAVFEPNGEEFWLDHRGVPLK